METQTVTEPTQVSPEEPTTEPRTNTSATVVTNEVEVSPDHAPDMVASTLDESEELAQVDVENLEYLQLQPEEAFFLIFAFGALELHTEDVSCSPESPFAPPNE